MALKKDACRFLKIQKLFAATKNSWKSLRIKPTELSPLQWIAQGIFERTLVIMYKTLPFYRMSTQGKNRNNLEILWLLRDFHCNYYIVLLLIILVILDKTLSSGHDIDDISLIWNCHSLEPFHACIDISIKTSLIPSWFWSLIVCVTLMYSPLYSLVIMSRPHITCEDTGSLKDRDYSWWIPVSPIVPRKGWRSVVFENI